MVKKGIPMTIAELLLVAALGYGLYKLLKPFQDRLEKALTKAKGRRRGQGDVIDVEPETGKKKGS